MDIISAHQQGLIEQLDGEVAALAGRPRDFGQRAVVLHHLYDHSGGQHGWALAEAREALRIAAGIATLRRRLERWGWLIARRDQAGEALDRLAEALGEAAAERTATAYRAYRLSTAKALRSEAEQRLPADLLEVLDQCHRARRNGEKISSEAQQMLCDHTEQLCAESLDEARLNAAWAAIGMTGLGGSARRLLGRARLASKRYRDERRDWARVEQAFRSDLALPAAFRANPAQHFYALQQSLAERRRQRWREACDREPDAFELAA